jgi:uncharacterized protein with HEPN domain
MRPDVLKLLEDMRQAAEHVLAFAAGRAARELETSALLRSAVERQFEIVGEALNRLVKIDRALAERIPDHRLIISFRNRLVHGYNEIDYAVVWDAIHTSLPGLLAEVNALLDEGTKGSEPTTGDQG